MKKIKRIVTGFVLVAGGLFSGAMLGLLWVKLFVPKKQMGWDGIADTLGGLMLGGLLGVAIAIFLLFKLSQQSQLRAGIVTLVLGGVVFGGLIATAPDRDPQEAVVMREQFEPFFRLTIRLSHTKEILDGIQPIERPLPFTEASISSSKPEFSIVSWGPEYEQCTITPSEDDLVAVVRILQELDATAGPFCKTPADDLTIAASWRIKNKSGNQSMEMACLTEKPALIELIDVMRIMAVENCS